MQVPAGAAEAEAPVEALAEADGLVDGLDPEDAASEDDPDEEPHAAASSRAGTARRTWRRWGEVTAAMLATDPDREPTPPRRPA
ncbi:hypothetical protein GCM10027596_29480 [Nocardioides korecus]